MGYRPLTCIALLLLCLTAGAQDGKEFLRERLAAMADGRRPAYGHQDDLVYGHAWTVTDIENDPLDRSDVKAVCGAYPMVAGFELGGIEKGDSASLDGVPFQLICRAAKMHAARGGIVTLSWHPRNPLTGGSTWDVGSTRVVASVLPGGENHEMFMEWLRRAADFIESLGVPVIFRPWHENTAKWFWWGRTWCTAAQYRQLYRMTWDYFTNVRGLQDILWCYSPTGDAGRKAYMATYPGDDVVDIFGMDTYEFIPKGKSMEKAGEAFVTQIRKELTYVTDLAAEHGKLAALTETGMEGIPDPLWWTERLAPAISGSPITYVLTWRNAHDKPGHYYGPWPGSGDAANFKALEQLDILTFLRPQAEELPVTDSLRLRFNAYSTWRSPEKVYLHYDRSCFTAGETIWFKGWVQEASRLSRLPASNFLYAEVLDDHGEAVVRVKIKRTETGFPGCIELPDNLETGDYTLRAYTLWQLNGDNEYLFNDRIRIIGGTGKKEKKRPEPPDAVDISFWPEGGRYFAGHKAVIGFKVTDHLGRSVDFNGFLINDADSVVRHIFTRHDGMGAFSFMPEPGHSYSIRDASGKMHPLPPPSGEGATLQLQVHSGRYYISALGFGGGPASLLVRDASELYPIAKVNLNGRTGAMVMEASFFRPGINHFLLVDAHGKILAERLFFIRDGKAPSCRLDMTQFPAEPRALASGIISLKGPDGAPLDGNCSVSIARGVLKDWQQSDGITSYMGLSSELKGRINNPYYYFDPEIPEQERDAVLDILMMVQGWRYYELDKIMDVKEDRFQFKYARERMQEIRGHISRMLSSKMPRKFTFTVMIPRQNVLNSVNVEQGRKFIVDSLDLQENTEVLINIGTSRLGANYLPKWDGDPAAEPYLYRPAPGFAKAAKLEAPLLGDFAADDTLQAAVVTAAYADDDVLVFGHNYREDLALYKDMTLVEYLSMKKAVFVYDGENMYNRHRRRSESSDEESPEDFSGFGDEDESGKVKLIVDDNEEEWWGFDMLCLGDLRSLNISTQPDPVYGGDGGVVHISVKPGGMRRSSERNPSLLYFVPLGYQAPRYFESPRYDRGESGAYDARNTIWWSPDVKIERGRGIIEFCNSDQMDYPYIVRIEGMSAEGRPFSHHCTISPAGKQL